MMTKLNHTLMTRRDLLWSAAALLPTPAYCADARDKYSSVIDMASQVDWFAHHTPRMATILDLDQDSIVSLVTAQGKRKTAAVTDPDSYWLQTCLSLVQKYRLNPLRASRAFAYCAVSMQDAHRRANRLDGQAREFSSEIAAAQTMAFLFPQESVGRWSLDIIQRNKWRHLTRRSALAGFRIGIQAAQLSIARALTDHSDPGGAMTQPPKNILNAWKATPPLWVSRATEPLAPQWITWSIDAQALATETPEPIRDGPRYQEAMKEVLETYKNLTPQQRDIAERWNLDLGTVTPAGVWLLKLLGMSDFNKLALHQRLGLAALVATCIEDAFIACWQVKFTWWTERPVTAIHREIDTSFMPILVTPAFPGYVSGHATISAAAATILGEAFPYRREECMQEANEAAASRLYGGIHFRQDNDHGLRLGQRIGQAVIYHHQVS